MHRLILAAIIAVLALPAAHAEAVHYTLDPTHTYPSFAAPHIAGISLWRGKFNHTRGSVVLDRTAHRGSVEVTIDMASVDFGLDTLNEHARGPDLFDVAKFPTATFKSDQIRFDGDRPVAIPGQLTLHGVTRPVTLTLRSFKCVIHPMLKREVCGADARAEIDRTAFGIDYGVPKLIPSGTVRLQIQVEGLRDDTPGPPG